MNLAAILKRFGGTRREKGYTIGSQLGTLLQLQDRKSKRRGGKERGMGMDDGD